MTLEEFKALSYRLTYKGKRCSDVRDYNWRDDGNKVPEGYIYVSIWIHAICVEDGKMTKIETGGLTPLSEIFGLNEASHISNVRDQLAMLEMHEVNENIALDDERIFNPHSFGEVIKLETQEDAA